MKLPIYLDYSATTPVDPRVAEKMMQCLTLDGNFGNPASRSHRFGWHAEEAVDIARNQIADLVGADPREIVFTSGATESDNLAIKGAANFYQKKGKHIITSKTEHKAVLDTCRQLEREGFEVTYLAPQSNGIIDLKELEAAMRDDIERHLLRPPLVEHEAHAALVVAHVVHERALEGLRLRLALLLLHDRLDCRGILSEAEPGKVGCAVTGDRRHQSILRVESAWAGTSGKR